MKLVGVASQQGRAPICGKETLMAAAITNRLLPGIGVCQEIDLRGGRRVGVVTHRDGRRDLVVYDVEGDGALDSVALSEEEADALAEILGAPHMMGVVAELQRQAAARAHAAATRRSSPSRPGRPRR
jgi:TrkA domain protein